MRFIKFLILLLFIGCGPRPYTQKELRLQKVPEGLMNRVWVLKEIKSSILGDVTADFNDSGGTTNCPFTFEFRKEGVLLMQFKHHQLKGVYVMGDTGFKYLHIGFREKTVWNLDPECKINPMILGYVMNRRSFKFDVQGNDLMLSNSAGERLILVTKD